MKELTDIIETKTRRKIKKIYRERKETRDYLRQRRKIEEMARTSVLYRGSKGGASLDLKQRVIIAPRSSDASFSRGSANL